MLRLVSSFALLFLLATAAGAQGMRDPDDGRIDLSEWLLDRKGVLPVPLIVTEPALGVGGGVMGLYFRESLREHGEKARESGRLTPPDIFALGFAGTDNGTRTIAGGGMVTSENGR
ncbi:MAG TPA: glyceraldehyde-3-phosphate dehydrogenase, partial [Ramlibacter sp.]|nr:glyceraldehyde-3-phosphate dehydrogenase [Ramlibacter sp.]